MGAGASASLPYQEEAAQLVQQLKDSNNQADRVDALKQLDKWAEIEQHKVPLCHPSLGFVDELMRLLRNNPQGEELNQIIYCFIDLSQGYENKPYLGSRELGLGKEFVNFLPEDNVYNTYTNLVMRHETHEYLLSREVGLMDHIMNRLPVSTLDTILNRDNIEKGVLPCKILANTAGCLREANLELFMSYKPHVAIMQRLKFYTKQQISSATNNVAYWCLNFVLRFSHFPVAAQAIKELDGVSFMNSIYVPNCMAGLKCTIIIANLIGREEGNVNKETILQSSPQTFELLLTLFHATLTLDLQDSGARLRDLGGHVFGGIKMRNIVGAIRSLSISDTNKPLLLKTGVLKLLIETLHLFSSNAGELQTLNPSTNLMGSAGGGGDDTETAELAIEALLQLSFGYDSFGALVENFLNGTEYDLIGILQECVSYRGSRLRSEAKRNATNLLGRLNQKTTLKLEAPSVASSKGSGSNKHIMLSYSWAVNKHLVVAMASRLRELGHDVWRDEEGSKILGPMQGDTDEKMASAIELAHTVIVFVSPQYKESGNCRTEAKYSKQRQLVCPLRILYVMMCENYHTRSNPPVDGWLALNIGTDIWYPLWSDSMLPSTAQAISELIYNSPTGASNGAKAIEERSPMTPLQTTPSISSAGPGEVNIDAAWSILHDKHGESFEGSVTEALNRLGLTEKEDMVLLEAKDVQDLAEALKIIPRKKFLRAMNC